MLGAEPIGGPGVRQQQSPRPTCVGEVDSPEQELEDVLAARCRLAVSAVGQALQDVVVASVGDVRLRGKLTIAFFGVSSLLSVLLALFAGVIGTKKFIYDLWGDTVNIASRMESTGLPGRIQMTETTAKLLRDQFELEERGPLEIKGKGLMTTYLLGKRREDPVRVSIGMISGEPL